MVRNPQKQKRSSPTRERSSRQTPLKKSPIKVREPQRCRKCPDRPLRSQCEHTVAGQTYLKSLESISNGAEHEDLGLPDVAPPTLPQPPQPEHVTFLTPPTAIHENPFLVSARMTQASLGTPRRHQALSSASMGPTTVSPQTATDAHSSPPCMAPKANSQAVEGAGQGFGSFLIHRTRELPELLEGQALSKRFNEQVKDIINRCERLAYASGAWIFFTAHYPTARRDFIHYSSPKLRKDAREDIERITNDFDTIFDSLMTSRRAEAYSRHAELRAKVQEKEESLKQKEAELNEKNAKLEQWEREAADLKERLRVAEGRFDGSIS
ncbi:uncharacterized protein LACBIDRAFT_307933 [Laccaria bicolor S238N-H82]|uniref:Predicted protein n=1 Tax=Laccaria bicolor (strain S238N-H82 / ATCC MYA-4686) TaxID=486041 RepID=B0DR86_LACBS|nr:uncharacterized protein LACBIDRAFT_307933 [Laccaria bicolor S238N-H82]EDR02739.1 predicted protein [Laccaria bicolor S238N-H82]|eukprot:XP_001886449.1 predicted protein [Laccaria bicolor S238N-H82]